MAEPTENTEQQAASPGAPPTPPTPPTGDQATVNTAATPDLDALKAERDTLQAKLREQGKQLKELDTFRAQAEERKKAEQTELDAAMERATQAETRATQAETRYKQESVVSAAARAGFRDASDAVRLIALDDIEYGDDGTPKNVDKLVGDLLKAKPYLGQAAAPPSAGQGVRQAANGADTSGAGLADADLGTSLSLKNARLLSGR